MTEPVHEKEFQLTRRVVHRLQRMRHHFLFRRHVAELRRLHGVHTGERCFIIGNGPSLSKLNLAPLKSEITFGTNAIFLNYEAMGFQPNYYCAYDTLLAEDRAAEINALDSGIRFFPQDLVYCLKPRPGVLYVPFHYTWNEAEPHFSRDVSEAVYFRGSVSFMCMQLAYHMGFNRVYLIGMDHNYKRPGHAQGKAFTATDADSDHFHSAYCGKGLRSNPYNVQRVEEAFQLAREVFEADGRKIINATAGGKLEVFPRADYHEVIASVDRKGCERD
jgi:hypothetical protein